MTDQRTVPVGADPLGIAATLAVGMPSSALAPASLSASTVFTSGLPTASLGSLTRRVQLLPPGMAWWCLAFLAALSALLWWLRTRHLPWRRQLAAPLAGVLVALLGWVVIDLLWHPVAEGLGLVVWTWVGLAAAVIVQVLLGGDADADRARVHARLRWALRAAGSSSAIVATIASVSLALNAHFAAYPNLAAVLGVGVEEVPLESLPAAAPLPQAPVRGAGPLEATWTAPADMPAAGRVVAASIPAGDQSGTRGFKPRPAAIYLPSAYLSQQRPALPVLVLLTGQPGSPNDWVELGLLKDTMDAYAAAHQGLAPVVVVADLLGRPDRNPLCSDTVRGGKVATYLERDVPAWVSAHLQVDPDHSRWAIGGLSNGGTCALQAVSRAPEVYQTFLAMSAEEHPSLGSVERTVRLGFGGDQAAYAANDPISLLAEAPAGRYAQVAGVVSVGDGDKRFGPALEVIAQATRGAGMAVETRRYHGGHSWSVWSQALADQVGWLGQRLGITTTAL